MNARIKSIDGNIIKLDNGETYLANSYDEYRLSSWAVDDKVKIGHDYLFHLEKEKKVHVKPE